MSPNFCYWFMRDWLKFGESVYSLGFCIIVKRLIVDKMHYLPAMTKRVDPFLFNNINSSFIEQNLVIFGRWRWFDVNYERIVY